MNWPLLVYPAIFLLLVLLPAPVIGRYIYWLMEHPSFKGESVLLKLCGIREHSDKTWRSYLISLLLLNLIGCVVLLVMLMCQKFLPFNPSHIPGMSFPMALNTAISFVTNTNWQSYNGATALSAFSQMVGLTVQNFLSAASGIAVAIVLFRSLKRRTQGCETTLGLFGQDLIRICFGLLLPLSFILALILVSQGVPQTFHSLIQIHSIDSSSIQHLTLGPVASQEAIKQIGTNGGGYYGANSAYPLENPTAFTNWLEMISILLIPAALVCTYGEYIGNRKHSFTILVSMSVLLVLGLGVSLWQQTANDPALLHLSSSSGLWEGIESRFGVVLSTIWGTATSAASNGSVNAMLDSFSPFAGMVALMNILSGEVIFGGVGSGIYGMLLFVILTVFLCGLMVGHTPTYLGKPLSLDVMKWVILTMLIMPVGVLLLGGLSICLPDISQVIGVSGPHGLTRLLYAYASTSGNNGSAFGGFNAANSLQEYLLSVAMILGRYGMMIPVLIIAGHFVNAKHIAVGAGEFPIHGPLFSFLLMSCIVLIGMLAFLPVLILGPIAEFLQGVM
ncbi:potassium-transporting ATPase subunit KdpA [Celerinatantimonas diazotrophica]|uniref:Potassium-transporting ATPase potassium-binding subunit n=1 Tax=Celerinatantimonas diazotrophica TaxID=412034 RepID=A0A4R1K1A2_9GAMM|nr:potassium-transporting ATPase subunit KdpA [Celerinatantimonas diazotrophica]TCK57758.1 K+-transporting ATPase ATPase A chain [Celerinatantimonas diazotrophica]CAG9298180.1 Potassium-transporting ATPase potassium-binding subunit [Celerinatantimonas diazotrophica]